MRTVILIIVLMCTNLLCAQENTELAQQYLEVEASGADIDEVETEDRQPIAEWYSRHRININRSSAALLIKEFGIPSNAALQLESYIRLAGPLIDILELQAVPCWDPDLVRSILPFITVEESKPLPHLFRHYLKNGRHTVQLRLGVTGEQSKAYQEKEPQGSYYEGNRLKALFRYNFSAGQLLRWGFAVEKDAGESLLNNGRSVDFSSFYFQMGGTGVLRSLVLGDFHINMGQGLIHWQSAAMRKSAETIVTLRQGNEIRAHTGVGEQQFHRGTGLNFQFKKWKILLFGAYDEWDANRLNDSVAGEPLKFSSIQTSGLHRTRSEIADKNAMKVFNAGAIINYRYRQFELGLNSIWYRFNGILAKEKQPANLYAINGNGWLNASIDYKYSFRSWYVFGELAFDQRLSTAFIGGIIAPLHPKVDLTIMYRWISPAYQALQANAFTEQGSPSNERGFYSGIRINVNKALRLSGYADLFSYPWLKTTISQPSKGNSVLLQVSWNPDKRNEVIFRFQDETKMEDQSSEDGVLKSVDAVNRRMLRVQQKWVSSKLLEFMVRADVVWIRKNGGENENGFLFYCNALLKPAKSPFSVALRVARFSTQGWASRLYSSERDVRNYHTLTLFNGNGWRQYLLLDYKFNKYIVLSAKAMLSYYLDRQTVGSGQDLINRPYRTDYRLQILVFF